MDPSFCRAHSSSMHSMLFTFVSGIHQSSPWSPPSVTSMAPMHTNPSSSLSTLSGAVIGDPSHSTTHRLQDLKSLYDSNAYTFDSYPRQRVAGASNGLVTPLASFLTRTYFSCPRHRAVGPL